MSKYHDILGVSEGATEQEIKKAYKTKAKTCHPDLHPDDDGAEERFKEINEAQDRLLNPDKYQQQNPFGGGGMDMNDIFSQFGGGRRRQQVRKGRDISLNIEIPLEEAFNGTSKKYKYKRNKPCEPCDGNGGFDFITCTNCNGQGSVQERVMGNFVTQSICNHCGGKGQRPSKACGSCNSRGVSSEEVEVSVDIPKGVATGVRMLKKGFGHLIKDGQPGDLQMMIIVRGHDKFVLDGVDFHQDVHVDVFKCLIGGEEEIECIDGNVKMKIPKLCETNRVFRVKGKGMSDYGTESRGDMFVKIIPKMPNELTEEMEEKLKSLYVS